MAARPGWLAGLGTSFLEVLMSDLGLPLDGAERATVAQEETCKDTRADMVLRTPGTTFILEAKVFAREQPEQCERLARGWADEAPTVVYLTRDGRTPTTALEAATVWQTMTWLAQAYGLVAVGNDRGWWLWRRQLAPGPDPLVIDEYVGDSIGKFAELWIAMHVVIQRAIEDVAESQKT